MAAEFDATEFIDSDFQTSHKAPYPPPAAPAGTASGLNRAPTREEVDCKVGETQQKLAELKRVQEELERERTALQETRRRQIEFQTGRQEVVQNLTRGTGLLEETEFAARRDAEQMAKSLADMREALVKVQALHEETWTQENFSVELTRALTAIENARMEWNAARLKFPVLSGSSADPATQETDGGNSMKSMLATMSFGRLCKIGLALTWPLALVALLLAIGVFLVILLRH
jgi:hypothetical protein